MWISPVTWSWPKNIWAARYFKYQLSLFNFTRADYSMYNNILVT